MIHFLQNPAVFCIKNANFFADFLGENILKIIILAPGLLATFIVSEIPCGTPQL
jgi:hypothetical protein